MIGICQKPWGGRGCSARSLVLTLGLAMLSAGAWAATFYVDGVDGSDANAGESWTSATQSIQQALSLSSANGESERDEIRVKGSLSGINYELTDASLRLTSNTAVLGGFRGDFDGDTERDAETWLTLFEGTGSAGQLPVHLVILPAGLTSATLDGITISGAYMNDSLGGGAIYGDATNGPIDSTNVIANCVIRDNVAEIDRGAFGGGVVALRGGACPRLENCRVDDNTVSITRPAASFGGAVALVSSTDTVTISNCTFNRNAVNVSETTTTRVMRGGVLYVSGLITIESCAIEENTISHTTLGAAPDIQAWVRGGALYIAASDFVSSDTTIRGNSVTSGYTIEGVACYVEGAETNSGLIHGGRICNNVGVAGGNLHNLLGGGIYILNGQLTVEDTLIAGNALAANTNTYGAGAVVRPNASAIDVTFNRCRFMGNASQTFGGAVALLGNQARLLNCAFGGNTAPYSTHLYVANTSPDIVNCTFNDGRLIGVLLDGTATPELVNCIFSGTVGGSRAAVYENAINSDAVLTNCLFTDNVHLYYDKDTSNFIDTVAGLNGQPGNSGVIDGPASYAMYAPEATTGLWSAVTYTTGTNRTTLSTSGAPFAPGGLAGRIVNPDTGYAGGPIPSYACIVSNTANAIVLRGDWTTHVEVGERFRLVDLQILDDSAAIDQGLDSSSYDPSLTMDINGRARVDKTDVVGPSIFDIGAYEYMFVPPPNAARDWNMYD